MTFVYVAKIHDGTEMGHLRFDMNHFQRLAPACRSNKVMFKTIYIQFRDCLGYHSFRKLS